MLRLFKPNSTHLLSNMTRLTRHYSSLSKSTAPMKVVDDENANNTDSSSSATVSPKEMNQFKEFANQWWTPGGEYEALQNLNSLRVPLVKKLLLNNQERLSNRPLDGFKVLDVGCGGGILAEPIARLGASILGIDPLTDNITAASKHASTDVDLLNLSYQCTTVESLTESSSGCFDLVIASEVIEHVNQPELFIDSCCELVKPGGCILITTINRNIISTALVKYAAEYLLRIVPQGTHDEEKFVIPDELTDMLRKNQMVNIVYKGMFMNPLTLAWSWNESTIMNYACYATKPIH